MRTRAAFSLVEVLISIVVLALGLLGLAAVFPAVVGQQRAATDSVLGQAVQNAVESYLLNQARLNQASVPNPLTDPPANPIRAANQRGVQLLTANNAWSPPVNPAGTRHNDLAGDWSPVSTTLGGGPISLDAATGLMRITGTAGGNPPSPTIIDIPLTQRLSPLPYSTSSQPLYVWDFVARRIPAGRTPVSATDTFGLEDDSVQLAVWVRRIDTGIRKPVNKNLADVLTGTGLAAPTDRRVPVAEDTNSTRPTFDGLGGSNAPNYSGIHRVDWDLAAALPGNSRHVYPQGSYITLDPTNAFPQLTPYARLAGQKLVDSFGVVHTVTNFLDRDPADLTTTIEVTPPIDLGDYTYWPSGLARGFWFTTQVPAAVFVITVPTPEPGSTF
jgi:type II secretory pathway pseudopilin PulG